MLVVMSYKLHWILNKMQKRRSNVQSNFQEELTGTEPWRVVYQICEFNSLGWIRIDTLIKKLACFKIQHNQSNLQKCYNQQNLQN
jgi:hypothetical protein